MAEARLIVFVTYVATSDLPDIVTVRVRKAGVGRGMWCSFVVCGGVSGSCESIRVRDLSRDVELTGMLEGMLRLCSKMCFKEC